MATGRYGVLVLVAAALPGLVSAEEPIRVGRNARGRVVATNVPRGAYAAPGPRGGPPAEAGEKTHAEQAPRRFTDLIREAAREQGVSPALMHAVVDVESGFDPRAVSPKGARGLMQLMPDTAQALEVTDVYDPRQNLRAGATHLRRLLDRYDGDVRLALAAYNAGEQAVARYGGVPPYPETRDYVSRVLERLAEVRETEKRREAVVPHRDRRGRVVITNVPLTVVGGGGE